MFNLLLTEYIFSKNTTKQKTKRKRSARVKAPLKNGRYSAFNNIFAELMVNDTSESILLRIIIYFLLYNRPIEKSYIMQGF